MLSRVLFLLLATSPLLTAGPVPRSLPNASYFYLPGGSGNYAVTPDSAANSITSSIEIRACATLNDWSSGAVQTFISKWESTIVGLSYTFRVNATGLLGLAAGLDGSATTFNQFSSVAVPFSDGAAGCVKVTGEFSGGNCAAKFYTCTDSTFASCSQLGTTKTAAIASIFDGTSPIEVGSQGGGAQNVATGRITYADIRVFGNSAAVVFNPSVTFAGDRTWTASTGEVWSVNGTAGLR